MYELLPEIKFQNRNAELREQTKTAASFNAMELHHHLWHTQSFRMPV